VCGFGRFWKWLVLSHFPRTLPQASQSTNRLMTVQPEAATGDLNHFGALQKSIWNGRRCRHITENR
jgi:hypothetical protein